MLLKETNNKDKENFNKIYKLLSEGTLKIVF